MSSPSMKVTSVEVQQAESETNEAEHQAQPVQTCLEDVQSTAQAAIAEVNKGEKTGGRVLNRIGHAIKALAQSAKQIAQGSLTHLEHFAQKNPRTALLLGIAGLLVSVMMAPVLLAPLPGLAVFAAIAASTSIVLSTAVSTLMNNARRNSQATQA